MQTTSICFVTFDQSLYIKPRDIVASSGPVSEINSVIIQFSGFHMIMFFIKSIGFIMDGSGLLELFNDAYAALSTSKIMTQYAYSRPLRACILTKSYFG